MKKKFDIYETITDRIVEALEKGTIPWQKPWESGLSEPVNAAANRPYSGINVFLLWLEQMTHNYETSGWMTYKQATELGAHVRKGEKSTMIVFWKPTQKTVANPETKEDEEKKFLILRYFNVFNLDQIEGLPEGFADKFKPKVIGLGNKLSDEYVKFIQAIPSTVIYGKNEACFIPSKDVIHMPSLEHFKSADDFAATELHEHGHWTGVKQRLDRNIKNWFGSEAYAFEELIAEMTSAFLGAHLGIRGEVDDNHAAYIGSWIKRLKEDKKAIFKASSEAKKAAEYLMKFSEPEEEEEEEEAVLETA